MKKYELYKIEYGKIHIFDIRDSEWDKYMCGQFKEGRDKELDYNISQIQLILDKICKRCFKKFVKTNPLILPDELFEI